MIIEVIVTTFEEAILAEKLGADRIELITGMQEGGLTPSYGLIKNVIENTAIPVNVMIRPHSYSFSYSEQDVITMLEDIKQIKKIGANGIVLGTLTEKQTIDLPTLRKLLYEAEGIGNVTFHRAYDELLDQEAGLTTLQRFPQINRILTSGGKPNVIMATNQIRKLVALTANQSCRIIAGCGLTPENIHTFIHETGVEEVHVGSGVRIDGKGQNPIDPERLRSIIKLAKN